MFSPSNFFLSLAISWYALDDQVGDDIVVVPRSVLEAGLGIQLGDLVCGLLHIGGTDAEPLRDLAPPVIDQLLEAVSHEAVRN